MLFWKNFSGKKKQCQIERQREEDGVVVENRKDILVVLAMDREV